VVNSSDVLPTGSRPIADGRSSTSRGDVDDFAVETFAVETFDDGRVG
jgi:hypothetical protein